MKTIIILLAGALCWSACQQPSPTEAPATDTMELDYRDNRDDAPVNGDTTNRTDTTMLDNKLNKNNRSEAISQPQD